MRAAATVSQRVLRSARCHSTQIISKPATNAVVCQSIWRMRKVRSFITDVSTVNASLPTFNTLVKVKARPVRGRSMRMGRIPVAVGGLEGIATALRSPGRLLRLGLPPRRGIWDSDTGRDSSATPLSARPALAQPEESLRPTVRSRLCASCRSMASSYPRRPVHAPVRQRDDAPFSERA